MALSNIVDTNKKSIRKEVENCHKNSTDCMFLNKDNGTCRAEWCIFEGLPEMVNPTVKITCDICQNSTKTVSVYSSERSYVCESCARKIRSLFNIYRED